ncbi:hypothetical protein [Hydrogenophaga soli]
MEPKSPPPSPAPTQPAGSSQLAALAEFKAQLARMSPEQRQKAFAALAQVVKSNMKVDDPR